MFIFQSTQKYTSAELHFCQNLVSNKYAVKLWRQKKKKKENLEKRKTKQPPSPQQQHSSFPCIDLFNKVWEHRKPYQYSDVVDWNT